jgi:hypothetical protein
VWVARTTYPLIFLQKLPSRLTFPFPSTLFSASQSSISSWFFSLLLSDAASLPVYHRPPSPYPSLSVSALAPQTNRANEHNPYPEPPPLSHHCLSLSTRDTRLRKMSGTSSAAMAPGPVDQMYAQRYHAVTALYRDEVSSGCTNECDLGAITDFRTRNTRKPTLLAGGNKLRLETSNLARS